MALAAGKKSFEPLSFPRLSLVEFLENPVLILRIGHGTYHFCQSSWVPKQFSAKQRDLAVMVFLVVPLAKPNDPDRIRVVFVMRNDVPAPTNRAAAPAQHTLLEQFSGLPASLPSQENQGVLDLLPLPDLPF